MQYALTLLSEYLGASVDPDRLLGWLRHLGLETSVSLREGQELVFQLETPANRGDLMCLIGLAREIAPLGNLRLQIPGANVRESVADALPVEIRDEQDCRLYLCRVIRDVRIGPSPAPLREKIEKLGFRAANNVVDISNYVMAETGQPLHVFDLDTLAERIVVRRAVPGEEIRTLDGRNRKLTGRNLVIADTSRAVAVAGVMGGANSEVTPGTTSILIESALFSPRTIRHSGRELGLSTEASVRFEKGLDQGRVRYGMDRTASLILDLCGGKAGPLSAAGTPEEEGREIRFNLGSLRKHLGVEIPREFVEKLLPELGFRMARRGKQSLRIVPAAHRPDIREDRDIIEEVARYWGYERIPATPLSADLTPTASDATYGKFERMRDIAVCLGYTEIVSTSFISEEVVEALDMRCLETVNPLSSLTRYFRPSLLPGMLENIRLNLSLETERFRTFELGKTCALRDSGLLERMHLGMASVDRGDFFAFKGAVGTFLSRCGLTAVSWEPCEHPLASPGGALAVFHDCGQIGTVVVPSAKVLELFEIKGRRDVYLAELHVEEIAAAAFPPVRFRELPRYPACFRDLSLIVSKDVPWKDMEASIRALGLPVERIDVFDIYRGDRVPQGSISVSFSVTFRAPDRTLRAEEVDAAITAIVGALGQQWGARLRT